MLALQSQDWSRPWYLAWAGAVYVPMTLVTFVWMVRVGRRRSAVAQSSPRVQPESSPSVRYSVGVAGFVLGWRHVGSATRD